MTERAQSMLVRSAAGSFRHLALTVFASVTGAVIDMGIAMLIMQLAKAGLAGDADTVVTMSWAMAAAIALGFGLKFAAKASGASFGAKAAYRIRSALFDHLTRMRQSDVEAKSAGDWMSVLSNDAFAIERFFTYHFNQLLFHPIMAVGSFVFLFILEWKLTLLCCVIMPLSLLASAWVGKPIFAQSLRVQEAEGDLNARTQDAVFGHDVIKAFGRQRWLRDRFEGSLLSALRLSLDLERLRALLIPWQILLQTLPMALCILYGGWLAIFHGFPPEQLLVFIYLLGYCMQSVSALPELIGQTGTMAGAVSRLKQTMEQPLEDTNAGRAVVKETMPNATTDGGAAIVFERVSFQYAGREAPALSHVTFEIAAGQFVAIVGASGSGKSSIAKLVSKLYEPDAGVIRLFGQSMSGLSTQSARSLLSVVTQQTFLFPGTIEENVKYGHSNATESDVVEACAAAGAHDFISRFPEGYRSVVGERGEGLSGGQRQRLALARALLKKAPILVLDEPTSALDERTEELVQQTLLSLRGSRTILVIAHRLSTAKDADRILVMDQGCLVEQGTHDELVRAGGPYARLHAYKLEGVPS